MRYIAKRLWNAPTRVVNLEIILIILFKILSLPEPALYLCLALSKEAAASRSPSLAKTVT